MNDDVMTSEPTEIQSVEELPEPLLNFILLEKAKEMKTAGGIHVPESAQPPFVYVIAVGPGRYIGDTFVQTTLRPGDRVLVDGTPSDIGTFRWGKRVFAVIDADYVKCKLPKEPPAQSNEEDTNSRILTPTSPQGGGKIITLQ